MAHEVMRSMNRVLTTVAVATTMVAGMFVVPQSALSMGIVRCAKGGDAGTAILDPIGDRGARPATHSHDFYGSSELLKLPHPELASAAQLISGGTTCTNKGDTAAYWQPTLFRRQGSSLERVSINRMEAYYMCWNGNVTCGSGTAVRTMPTDLRMIAGNPAARGVGDMTEYAYWHCGLFSSKPGTRYHFASPELANCAAATPAPGHPSGVALTAAITFPSCWDGRLNDHTHRGNTADYSGQPGAVRNHLAYPGHHGGAVVCPSGYPIHLPRLRENIQWNYRGDGRDLHLASDMSASGPVGVSIHADFLQSWGTAALQALVSSCINTTQSEASVHRPPKSKVCGGPVPN